MLVEFGASLYVADGPTVSFFGFPYPTRMAAVRLADANVWVWSPIALTDELAHAIEQVGAVRHIVTPNKLHHLFLAQWAERWPQACLYAPPGLARRMPNLRFDAQLQDAPQAAWAADIDQVIFRGSFAMEEVVFFHKASRTAIFGDLIQRHARGSMSYLKDLLMRFDGLVGERGSTPREWRASFLDRKSARRARQKVIDWKADRLLIAHGENVTQRASDVIADALDWI